MRGVRTAVSHVLQYLWQPDRAVEQNSKVGTAHKILRKYGEQNRPNNQENVNGVRSLPDLLFPEELRVARLMNRLDDTQVEQKESHNVKN